MLAICATRAGQLIFRRRVKAGAKRFVSSAAGLNRSTSAFTATVAVQGQVA
jgi:hypothetical protein